MVTLALFALYLCMFASALAFTVIYPFASLMVQRFGMVSNRSTTGFWVGLLSFSLMSMRMLSSPFWGMICDRWGRRPFLLVGISALVVFSVTFGLSEQYSIAIASRLLLGMLCCVSLIGNTLISELTNTSPTAMGWIYLSWQSGNIAGNIVGGVFATPAETGLLELHLFEMYPFLLPNLVVALVGFIGLVLCVFSVPETLNKQHQDQLPPGRGFNGLLKDRSIMILLILNAMYTFVIAGFDEIISLVLG